MRPIYETQDDLDKERKIADFIERKYKRKLEKIDEYAPADFIVYKQTAFIEVRNRRHSYGAFPTLMIAKHKVDRGLNYVKEIPYVLVVKYIDCITYIEITPEKVAMWEVKKNDGRSEENMRDKYDKEDCYHIPVGELKVFCNNGQFIKEFEGYENLT